MIGTDCINNVLKTFFAYKESDFFLVRILSITIAQELHYIGFTAKETIIKNDIVSLLRAIDGLGNAKAYSTVVMFHGQTARDEDVAKVSSFFRDDEEMEFAMLDGKQDDFDFIIGAM